MAEYMLQSDLTLRHTPQTTETNDAVDVTVPRERSFLRRSRLAGAGAMVGSAVVLVAAAPNSSKDFTAFAASEVCPKPIGSLSSSRPAPNPGSVPIGGGVASVRVTGLGIEGGYGCAGESESIGILVENTGNESATNVRLYAGGQNELSILPQGILINGQPANERCEFPHENSATCTVDDSLLPGEQIYIDTGVSRKLPGQALLSTMIVTDAPEFDFQDNMADQTISIAASIQQPNPIVKTYLAKPKLSYTDRYRPGVKKGQKSCRVSTVSVKIGQGQPPAEDVKFRLSPKGNLKFKTGVKSFSKIADAGDISRERFGYASIRACTIGKRAVVGFLRVSAVNVDPQTYRLSFSAQTNKWKTTKAKTPSTAAPTPTAPSR